MASTARAERELVQKCKQKLNDKDLPPIEKLRCACLARGASGIKGLGRTFRIMDDDGNRSLDFKEFKKGIHDYGIIDMEDPDIKALFDELDKDHSGSLDFDEFLIALRGPMNRNRKELVDKAFKKLDKTGDGVVTADDLKGTYNCKKHPKYLNGEWTEDQIYNEFLKTFQAGSDEVDEQVSKDEFLNYYAGVSASIDNEVYFQLVMKNSWGV